MNYYQLGATLSGHTDHSEDDLTAPLISMRCVCVCVCMCVCACNLHCQNEEFCNCNIQIDLNTVTCAV